MKLSPKILSWFVRPVDQEEDRADIEYIREAKRDVSLRPWRDVFAEVEAEERGEFHGPVRQQSR